jgi:hypothetical protein
MARLPSHPVNTSWIVLACCMCLPISVDAGDESSSKCPPGNAASHSWGYCELSVEVRVLNSAGLPVSRVRLYTGQWEGDRFQGQLKRVRAESSRDGHVRFQASAEYSALTGCREGEPYRAEKFGREHYLLRAKGCEDVILEVSGEWTPRDVIMTCANE